MSNNAVVLQNKVENCNEVELQYWLGTRVEMRTKLYMGYYRICMVCEMTSGIVYLTSLIVYIKLHNRK